MDYKRRNQGEAFKSVRFKRSVLAMCVMAISAPSLAQDAKKDETSVDEVVITGQRANLQNAQEIKKNASTFVDSVSSEDIGSLPDRSVLEAMQRIPGVSIERFAAANDPDHFGVEGSGATIRGMSQTRSEFNGRDSFTANSGRGLSFQDVPPELMAGVDIYKNQSADMIEGGIGGTVSLRTRKPFDQPGRKLAFTADVSYGDMVDKYSPTGSLLYSDRWETDAGEFGVLVNLTNSELKGQSNGIQSDAYVEYRDDYTGFYRPLTGGNAAAAGPNDIKGAEAFIGKSIWMPNGSNLTMKTDDRTRKGYYTDIQWESSDQTLSNNFQFLRSDALLSWKENAVKYQSGYDRRQSIPLKGTEFTFNDKGLFQSGIITQDGSFSDGGWRSADPDNPNFLRLPHAASWANPYVQQYGNRFQTDTRVKDTRTLIDDFSDTFKWSPNEKWDFSLDLQYIKAKTDDDDVTVMMATHAIQQFDLTHGTPKLTLIEPWHGIRDQNMDNNGVAGKGPYGKAGTGTKVNGKLLPGFSDDPAGDSNYFQDVTSYWWQSAMDHYERSQGTSKAGRFDVVYHFDDDAGLLKAVKAGVRYADREQTVKKSTYNWGQLAPIWAQPYDQIGWLDTPVVKDIADQYEQVDWSKFYRGDGVLNVPGNYMLHPKTSLVQSIIDTQRKLPTGGSGNLWENVQDRPGVIPGTKFLPSEVFVTKEVNEAAYVRFDFESDIGERTLKGNVGLRVVQLDRTATGSVQYPDLAARTPVPAGAPDPRNTAAHLAYLQAKRDSLLAAAKTQPTYASGLAAELAKLPATATQAEKDTATNNYNDSVIKTDYDAFAKYAGDMGNFLSQTELGFGNNAASVESAESSYTKVLPSLNLAYNITDDLIGRFAWSKALANPDMSDVRNTTSLSALQMNQTFVRDLSVNPPRSTLIGAKVDSWAGSAGNPYLKPMESKQMDAALEWYFAKSSSLTFTVFKKDLSDFWIQGAFDRTYTNPTSGITQTALVTGTINNGEGTLKGFELAYQQFFDFLPAPFDGLGAQFNYSYIKSESFPNSGAVAGTTNDTGAPVDLAATAGLPLQGQSKNTYNVTAMYEKGDWSARLAYNWRSRYLLTTRDVISKYPLWNDENGFLDGSVNYKINDNFTVGLQFTNLLNTQTKTIMILDGKGLEAGRSWFENDRRAALTLKGNF
ncbi:TonB-dependent receptor [Cellvibrio sp.]|uniref:TonB-dependent receptor n=1 Tax=Cellvibrio sp. TaxID=1965322 RepID=UPI00396486BE